MQTVYAPKIKGQKRGYLSVYYGPVESAVVWKRPLRAPMVAGFVIYSQAVGTGFDRQKTAGLVFELTKHSWWWKIVGTTMSTRNKKSDPKPPVRRNSKLPPGTVLLSAPENPANDFKCVRCRWEWPSRKKGGLPARCPHCSSPAWNKARAVARRTGLACHCKHCGWDWVAVKTEGLPAICPRCRKYDWNDEPALPSAKPPGIK